MAMLELSGPRIRSLIMLGQRPGWLAWLLALALCIGRVHGDAGTFPADGDFPPALHTTQGLDKANVYSLPMTKTLTLDTPLTAWKLALWQNNPGVGADKATKKFVASKWCWCKEIEKMHLLICTLAGTAGVNKPVITLNSKQDIIDYGLDPNKSPVYFFWVSERSLTEDWVGANGFTSNYFNITYEKPKPKETSTKKPETTKTTTTKSKTSSQASTSPPPGGSAAPPPAVTQPPPLPAASGGSGQVEEPVVSEPEPEPESGSNQEPPPVVATSTDEESSTDSNSSTASINTKGPVGELPTSTKDSEPVSTNDAHPTSNTETTLTSAVNGKETDVVDETVVQGNGEEGVTQVPGQGENTNGSYRPTKGEPGNDSQHGNGKPVSTSAGNNQKPKPGGGDSAKKDDSNEESSTPPMSGGTKAGIAVGVVVCIALIVPVVVYFIRRRGRKSDDDDDDPFSDSRFRGPDMEGWTASQRMSSGEEEVSQHNGGTIYGAAGGMGAGGSTLGNRSPDGSDPFSDPVAQLSPSNSLGRSYTQRDPTIPYIANPYTGSTPPQDTTLMSPAAIYAGGNNSPLRRSPSDGSPSAYRPDGWGSPGNPHNHAGLGVGMGRASSSYPNGQHTLDHMGGVPSRSPNGSLSSGGHSAPHSQRESLHELSSPEPIYQNGSPPRPTFRVVNTPADTDDQIWHEASATPRTVRQPWVDYPPPPIPEEQFEVHELGPGRKSQEPSLAGLRIPGRRKNSASTARGASSLYEAPGNDVNLF